MDITRASSKPQEEMTALKLGDRQIVTAKGYGSHKQKDKQSLDYVLRTGLAGGLAGCAVHPAFLSSHYIKIGS